jgi:hypothetical protein
MCVRENPKILLYLRPLIEILTAVSKTETGLKL